MQGHPLSLSPVQGAMLPHEGQLSFQSARLWHESSFGSRLRVMRSHCARPQPL